MDAATSDVAMATGASTSPRGSPRQEVVDAQLANGVVARSGRVGADAVLHVQEEVQVSAALAESALTASSQSAAEEVDLQLALAASLQLTDGARPTRTDNEELQAALEASLHRNDASTSAALRAPEEAVVGHTHFVPGVFPAGRGYMGASFFEDYVDVSMRLVEFLYLASCAGSEPVGALHVTPGLRDEFSAKGINSPWLCLEPPDGSTDGSDGDDQMVYQVTQHEGRHREYQCHFNAAPSSMPFP